MHVINMVLSLFSQEAVKQVTGEADRKERVSDVSTVIFFCGGDFLQPDPERHTDITFIRLNRQNRP